MNQAWISRNLSLGHETTQDSVPKIFVFVFILFRSAKFLTNTGQFFSKR